MGNGICDLYGGSIIEDQAGTKQISGADATVSAINKDFLRQPNNFFKFFLRNDSKWFLSLSGDQMLMPPSSFHIRKKTMKIKFELFECQEQQIVWKWLALQNPSALGILHRPNRKVTLLKGHLRFEKPVRTRCTVLSRYVESLLAFTRELYP